MISCICRKENKFKYYVHQQKFKSSKNIIKQLPNKINDQLNKRSSTEENVLKVKKKITNQ